MATLSAWPWGNYGNLKYLLYAPLAAQVVYSLAYEEDYSRAFWCLNVLIICGLKGLVHVLWSTYNNMLFLTRTLRINPKGVDFKQIDHEWDWDNYILLQAILASMICYMSTPSMLIISTIPLWNMKGLIVSLVLHVTFSEPLYYFLHRYVHRNNYLFTRYHSFHHSSPVPNPMTANNATLLESLILCVVAGVPLIGSFLLGVGSISLIYGYAITFDFLRCLGHCNVAIFSHKVFETLPILRYLIYTPTYHSLHHQNMETNFCLFMPIFDVLGSTLNPNSWELQRKIRIAAGEPKREPEFVFLAHGVDVMSAMHAPFLFRSFASMPYTTRFFLLLMWPGTFMVMLVAWLWSKAFLCSFYTLRNHLCQTWLVPRLGFHYFLPFAKQGINNLIEDAILRADKLGVKVISLAALNKNEALNGGGTLFVNKHPDLRVRVVHGNTLTAAVILNEIPKDVKEVFLTGATSKLGRAIALYLCRRGVRVLMLTLSTERFQKIQKEAPAEFQNYLVQVTKYNAAQHCKSWIVGKWLTPREQSWAPEGTHFHQFVVPPILNFRRKCTYGDLAAMRLPKDVQGVGTCEYTMERGVVHACHAGGLVHMLEGWEHHEVGAIDVDRIDINEALNGGGTLFVNKHPDLRVRVVHGNTLTAAVILNGVPKDVKEVFLIGATSKLGRAIALYLCRRGVRVLMLTLSVERFEKIQKEAPSEFQKYLVQVTKYNSAQHCKTWIVGKWLTPREQSWAPAGTHFHQFVVPPILKFRRNCTYDELAAMRLPKDVQGLGTCEYTMDRGVVHACHAGGLVHMLEGWEHHEVGAIDVDRIDLVWEAAMRHGLSSVSSLTD
ncbi:unnamed protein product [Brassica rapa subsp. trilocularis]